MPSSITATPQLITHLIYLQQAIATAKMEYHQNMSEAVNRNYTTGHAVAVLIITPQGIPLIRDPKKPAPIFWKAPGGRSNTNENAKSAAVREVKEETGITLAENDLLIIHEEDRGSHVLTLFVARIASIQHLKINGDEGEEIKLFLPKEILAMPDFFPNHRRAFEKILATL